MKSIYFRQFLSVAISVLLSFIVLAVAFVLLGRSYVIHSYEERANSVADEVRRSASAYSVDSNLMSWGLRMSISSISSSTGNHIFITNSTGRIISCSDVNVACNHIGETVSPEIMQDLTEHGSISTVSHLGKIYDKPFLIVAKRIDSSVNGELLGYVFIGSSRAGIVGAWTALAWAFILLTTGVALIALVLALVTSKKMSEPLEEMASAARKYGYGDFSHRVKQTEGEDELAELTSAFNNMAESLERSEELRNEFIANVSHELKTPMTTISGFADGLLDGTIPKEDEEKYLATIADETRRLSRLVRRMLDLSQMQSRGNDLARRSTFEIDELIIRTLLNFETRAEDKNLEVELDLPEDSIAVIADHDAITQVLYNLLDNAVKFARPKSKLAVSLWKQEGKAYVSIKNEGDTIPEDDLSLIFDRFHKSDRSRSLDREGVGLGLYLVKSILDAHGEAVAVKSKGGVTVFVFTLRLSKEKPKLPQKPESETAEGKKRKYLPKIVKLKNSGTQSKKKKSAEKENISADDRQ
ncbi:MAG: HAMP domain-containing histidine kinase [Ruminococcaceae bacterium]|nr:HAMP domain-containing histidine kinase [Oscillospiraceae bacterium]